MCSGPGSEGGIRVPVCPRGGAHGKSRGARLARSGDRSVMSPSPRPPGSGGNLHRETSEILVGEREIVGPSSATTIRPATHRSRRAGRDTAGLFAPWGPVATVPPRGTSRTRVARGRAHHSPESVRKAGHPSLGHRGTTGVSAGARRRGRAPAPPGHPDAARCVHSCGATGLRPRSARSRTPKDGLSAIRRQWLGSVFLPRTRARDTYGAENKRAARGNVYRVLGEHALALHSTSP